MATKMGRKEMIAGHTAQDFEIVGRASRDQSDFGSDVGCADMACVNQFGEANNSKYYHAAVVRSTSESTNMALIHSSLYSCARGPRLHRPQVMVHREDRRGSFADRGGDPSVCA